MAQAPSTPLHRLEHVPLQAEHDLVGGGPEEVFLAAEVAIDGPFADPGPVGDHLDVGAAEAEFGKGADGLFEDGLPLSGVFGASSRFEQS